MTGNAGAPGNQAAVPTPAPIRVAIVDDHPVVREGTSALLAAQPGLEVVGTAGDLEAARRLVDMAAIDVLLLDIRLGSESGLRMLVDRSRRAPAIVVVTAYDYPQYVRAALERGAAGFVLKTAPVAELVDTILRAAAGEPADVTASIPAAPTMSPRELEVTRLVAAGRSNDEIAGALGIGAKTVETHLARLFDRFGAASRTELATRAVREGWLDLP